MGENRKPMIVEGYAVPFKIEDDITAWMRRNWNFKAHDVIRGLIHAGVPGSGLQGGYSPAYRIADRLLQRERRAGNISFHKGRWSAVPSPAQARGR